ncbi:MAG: hypothetical protein DRP85_08150 [Candidatus Makaraimicrobium thalassicum]|nr:MAG: hypothetical protein DRP85_08150 [Candidatus Omnitrophota bacterium]
MSVSADLEEILAEKVGHEEEWEQRELGKVKPVHRNEQHPFRLLFLNRRKCARSPFMFMRRRRYRKWQI